MSDQESQNQEIKIEFSQSVQDCYGWILEGLIKKAVRDYEGTLKGAIKEIILSNFKDSEYSQDQIDLIKKHVHCMFEEDMYDFLDFDFAVWHLVEDRLVTEFAYELEERINNRTTDKDSK